MAGFEQFVGVNFWTMIFAWCNLLILYFALRKILFRPIMNMIESRRKEIDDIYSKAEGYLADARADREEYARTGVWQNALIPGACKALETFQKAGFTLALATSKPKHFAQKILDRWELSHFFEAVVGPYEGNLETKAEVIQEALRITGANGENCLMIGDRKHDLEGANANGIDCAIVLTGYAEADEFERVSPKYILSSFEELTKTILSK